MTTSSAAEAPSLSRVRATTVLTITAVAAFVALWLVVWIPVITVHNEGWLLLFPIFFAVWGVMEIIGISAVVLAIIDLVKRKGVRRARYCSFTASLAFSILSLPILIFGVGPQA